MSVLGERIAHRRRVLDMTQDVLAEMAETTQRQISKYEKGINTPSSDVLAKIAVALDTTTDWLVGLTENSQRPLRNSGDLDELERKAIEILRSQDAETRQKMVKALEALV